MNEKLPTAAVEREWLLDEIASLIAHCGEATFLDAPIVEPTERFFPDAWRPDEEGVASLARRVFAHAGLESVAVEVSGTELYGAKDGSAWLDGLENGACRIGVCLNTLDTADPCGALALVASRVFRETKGLSPDRLGVAGGYREQPAIDEAERALEAKRVEATAIYLGFGILVGNHCFASRHMPGVRSGGTVIPQRRHTELQPWTFAFGLAVQVAVRVLGFWERRHLVGQLSPIQIDHFRAAWELVDNDVDGLVKRLRLSTSVSSSR